jgi:P27 family predicted phage terminase small subunit
LGGLGSGGDRRSKGKALRELHGARSRKRHSDEPSVSNIGTPEMPPGMSPQAKPFWRYYAPRLEAMRVLAETDRDALADYCEALAQLEDIARLQAAPEYRRLMLTVTVDGAGNEKIKAETNPLDAQRRQWTLIARQLRGDLGLSPATRARVSASAPEQADVDPFAQFEVHQGGKS